LSSFNLIIKLILTNVRKTDILSSKLTKIEFMTFNTNSHRDIAKGANGRYTQAAPGSTGETCSSLPTHPNLDETLVLFASNTSAKELFREMLNIQDDKKYDDLKAELHYMLEKDWRKAQERQPGNNQNPAGRETPQGGIGR